MPPKSSAALLDYSVDFTGWLTDTGDMIESGGVSATVRTAAGFSYDLAVIWAEPFSGTQAVVMLASGPAGTFQIVNVQVITQQGRTCTQEIIVPIIQETEIVDLSTH
ncbi:phage fiber-tail adaptor protein [Acetobacter oeni]